MVDIQLNNVMRTIGGIHMTNPHPWLSVLRFIVLLKINAKKALLDPLGAAGNVEAVNTSACYLITKSWRDTGIMIRKESYQLSSTHELSGLPLCPSNQNKFNKEL